MKAVVLEQNEVLSYREMPTPAPGANEVLIKVAVCGICGSDVPRVYDHAARSYPMVLGHEFSGVVEQIGEHVSSVKVGDHVVAAPLIPCMECVDCKNGNYALCQHYSFVGSRQQGAMADYVVVPAENVVPISADVPFDQAATIEPATVALHALYHAKFEAGTNVVVLGCGIIGLYTIQWAKLLGAASVTAIGRGQKGLEAAAKLGADRCFSTKEVSEEELLKKLEPRGYDYVIESSGATQTIQLSLKLVAKKGTVCLIGTPKTEMTFSVSLWEQINRKECRVTGSWMSYSAPFPGKEWTASVDAMTNGALLYLPGMFDQTYPMGSAKEAFDSIRSGKSKGRVLLSNILEEGKE